MAKDIKARRSFGFKTSYATVGTVESLCGMTARTHTGTPDGDPSEDDATPSAAAGYAVHVYYIGTRAAKVNKARAREAAIDRLEPCRDPDLIDRQWTKSLANTRRTIKLFDEVTLIDGTRDLQTLAVVRRGVLKDRAEAQRGWATAILKGLEEPDADGRTAPAPTATV